MLDKDSLLKVSLPEDVVDIPGRGEVRVRSLTRAEALTVQHADTLDAEALALCAGLVDPELTMDEVRALLDAMPAADLQPVVNRIMELSGLVTGAQKSNGTGTDDGGRGPNALPAGP